MSPIKMPASTEDSAEIPKSDAADRETSITECEGSSKVCVSSPTEGGEASTPLDPDISDVLFGLCPEDLSFSFHTSHDQTLSPSILPEPRTCNESNLVNAVTADWSSLGETHLQSTGTFFGLPMKVKECLKEYRKIDQLYGNYTIYCLHGCVCFS